MTVQGLAHLPAPTAGHHGRCSSGKDASRAENAYAPACLAGLLAVLMGGPTQLLFPSLACLPLQLNFACGTRSDTGGPRCVVCPQMCVYTCGTGSICDRDPADGCFKCLPGGVVCCIAPRC